MYESGDGTITRFVDILKAATDLLRHQKLSTFSKLYMEKRLRNPKQHALNIQSHRARSRPTDEPNDIRSHVAARTATRATVLHSAGRQNYSKLNLNTRQYTLLFSQIPIAISQTFKIRDSSYRKSYNTSIKLDPKS